MGTATGPLFYAMKVSYITDGIDVPTALEELAGIPKLCLDFETTGLCPHFSEARLLQLCDSSPSIEDRTIYVFDLFKLNDRYRRQLFELVASREMLVAHNMHFDYQFLLANKCEPKSKIFCTLIAERVLRAGFKEVKYSVKNHDKYYDDLSVSLKNVAARRLDLEVDKEQQLSDWSKDDLDLEQIEYAAKDVDILPAIAAQQLSELAEENLVGVFSLESKIIGPVAKMSFTGFNVDINKLRVLEESIRQELDPLTNIFCEALDERLPDDNKLPRSLDGTICVGKNARKEFNPGSNAQCLKYFDSAGIETPRSISTGKPSLSKIELAEFDSDDEIIDHYRKRKKKDTMLSHVQKLINNVHPLTHRIHSGYRQYGANSGRFTSSGAKRVAASKTKKEFSINCQQIPRDKEFRECFIPSDGYKIVVSDFSQIELRLGAELVNIPNMKKAFLEGKDLHTVTASLIYNIPFDQVTKQQRQDGKTLNFALLYGMGYKKYRTYSAQSGRIISLSDAKLKHAAFHRAYPQLKTWHKQNADLVSDGWTYSRTATGRRRLLSYDDASMMAACNNIIQGAGADILKIALANLADHLSDELRLIACVHDEIVLEVKSDRAEECKTILEDCMKRAGEMILKEIPVTADAASGNSWAEAK